MPGERTRRVSQSANRFGATTRIKRTCVDGQPCTHEHADASTKLSESSGGRIRERRPIVKPARPRAMRTATRARVRVISSYETLCVVRSLVCVRTRTRDAPRRRRRVTIECSRRGASGGALAVGTPPPRARARFLVASFFFFSPFSPIAISRSRKIAKSRATVGVVEVEKVEKVDMGRFRAFRVFAPSTANQ